MLLIRIRNQELFIFKIAIKKLNEKKPTNTTRVTGIHESCVSFFFIIFLGENDSAVLWSSSIWRFTTTVFGVSW